MLLRFIFINFVVFLAQDYYLGVLGVSPFNSDSWSLTVHPRSLAVLVSVVLHRQQKERTQKAVSISPRSASNSADAAIISVWNKFLKRLQTTIESTETKIELLEGKWMFYQV